jgi:hypothetical protein
MEIASKDPLYEEFFDPDGFLRDDLCEVNPSSWIWITKNEEEEERELSEKLQRISEEFGEGLEALD